MIKKKHYQMAVCAIILMCLIGVALLVVHKRIEATHVEQPTETTQTASEDDSTTTATTSSAGYTETLSITSLHYSLPKVNSTPVIPEEPTETLIKDAEVLEESEEAEKESDEPKYVYTFTPEEDRALLKLAFAEAGNQDVDGKVLVMLVVLNRMASDEFSYDSIMEVIYAENQFSVIWNGMYDVATDCDPGCLEALELVKQGYDISQGATYFESMKSYDSWHYRNLNFLFEHGDHWFYN